ncbi:MAG: DUF3426 domain-containing protein [Pseudomonadota bacterium]
MDLPTPPPEKPPPEKPAPTSAGPEPWLAQPDEIAQDRDLLTEALEASDSSSGGETADISRTTDAADQPVLEARSRQIGRLRADPMDAPKTAPPPQPMPPVGSSTAPLVVGWILVIGLLAAAIAGGWYFRDSIVAAIPEASRLYALVGIDVQPDKAQSLEIEDLAWREETLEGEPTLVVSGVLRNVTGSTRPIPTLIARVLGPDGVEITQWRFRVGVLSLPPAGTRSFETRRPYPNRRGALTVEVMVQETQL